MYLNIAGQDITNKNQFWAPLPAKSVRRIQWVVCNNHVRGNKTFTHFVRSAQMDFQPYFASRYAQNWFYLSSVLQCYTATPKTDFRLLYIGMLFSYVPFCNVLAVYRKLISNALHKDVFGQKIGAVNDNAPAAPTSRKLDIGESLSAYLQANIKILHFFK